LATYEILLSITSIIVMNFTRKYDIRIPRINERIHEFLKAKHLTGQVDHEFEPADVNAPTGWATLTVDTADPKLHNELDSFISNLERIYAAQRIPEPELSA
jgi:hypothetical protein